MTRSGKGDGGRAEKVRRCQASQQRTRRRRLTWVSGVVAALVVIGVVGGVWATRGGPGGTRTAAPGGVDDTDQVMPAAVTGTTTVQRQPKRVPNPTDIDGILAWDTAGYPGPGTPSMATVGHDHVPGPVRYAVTPPIGGPHNSVWMNAGIYTKPVPNERAVHNLEHGAVWITYRPGLPAKQVGELVDFVDRQSLIPEEQATGIAGQQNRFIDLSPWKTNALPSPIVISAWGYQLRVDNASDSRLQQFVDSFRNSRRYTPEYGSPVDGVPVQTGGVAAADGATKPNPPGKATSGM